MLSCTGTRTTSSAVTFTKSFRLGRDPRELPPGVYTLHTLEEVYEGAFNPLYRAVTVEFEVHSRGGKSIRIIQPEDLAAALKRDNPLDEVIA